MNTHHHDTPTSERSDQLGDPLDELAQLVEAVPPQFRASVVESALNFEPSGSFEQSYLVGLVRAAITDLMLHHFGSRWRDQMQAISTTDASVLWARLNRLATAQSPQRIRRQLIELLQLSAEEAHAAD